MDKHTKGEWTFSPQVGSKEHCFQAQIWTSENEEYIATVNSTEDESEANANAKLMAAAPELLEGLIFAIEALRTFHYFKETVPIVRRLDLIIDKLL